jgi:hypothetical protein
MRSCEGEKKERGDHVRFLTRLSHGSLMRLGFMSRPELDMKPNLLSDDDLKSSVRREVTRSGVNRC